MIPEGSDSSKKKRQFSITDTLSRAVIVWLCVIMLMPPELAGACSSVPDRATAELPEALLSPQTPDVPPLPQPPGQAMPDSTVYLDAEALVPATEPVDTVKTVVVAENSPYGLDGKKIFNPDPERAVWMSALFPGLGQVYNRRYWKIPIIIGGFMGLGYATSWNNGQLRDYTQAYRDLSDSDPSTNSYMNFFPPNTLESSLDKEWLTSTMRSRKNFYRRNRDLCIICIVALYLLCMVDAYVDASMAHFDISSDLSMDVAPSMMFTPGQPKPALGMCWAFTF